MNIQELLRGLVELEKNINRVLNNNIKLIDTLLQDIISVRNIAIMLSNIDITSTYTEKLRCELNNIKQATQTLLPNYFNVFNTSSNSVYNDILRLQQIFVKCKSEIEQVKKIMLSNVLQSDIDITITTSYANEIANINKMLSKFKLVTQLSVEKLK